MKKIEFNSSLLDTYFQLLKNLSDGAKQQLIDRLTKSLNKEKGRPGEERELFGAWESEENADEIIKSLRTDRNIDRQIEDM